MLADLISLSPISFPEYACSRVMLGHNITRAQAYSGNEIGLSHDDEYPPFLGGI
jgi:hypothetical protein